jgi:hypothetical protein
MAWTAEDRRKWRERNPGKQRQAEQQIWARNRAIIQAAKDRPCVGCGSQHEPSKMHFDHRPGEVKLFNVGAALTRSVAVLTAEIAKCDVRCATCHGRRHDRERGRSGGRYVQAST